MTGTRRTPTGRQHTPPITEAAVKTFIEMQRCVCTCDPDVPYDECPGCKRWKQLDERLMYELKLDRVVYPTISNPEARNPYPPGTHGYVTWEPDREGQARWLALEQAAREMRQKERKAQRARKVAEQPPPAPPEQPPVG
jgi:hypothetical protein